MRRLLCLIVCIVAAIAVVPTSTIKAEGDEPVSCSGVNRIEVNDPAEQKGGPNDIKTVTLEIFRSRSNEGKQIRKMTFTMSVHSRFEAVGNDVLGIEFQLKLTDTSGKTGIFGDILSFSGVLSGGMAYLFISDKDWPNSIIDDIETTNNIKIVCANIKFRLLIQDVTTRETKVCDETEWSDKQVDFADTTQPQNPLDLNAENDVGCVKVSWKKAPAISGSMQAENYRIYKDGALIGTVPANATFYKDCEVEAGKTYKYAVCGVSPWNVESPRSPLTYTYTPAPKIIPDKTQVEFGQIEIDKLKPQRIKLSNYGDMDADCKLEASDDWFTVTPSALKIEKTKRTDVDITINPDKIKPNTSYEGSIKITWGTSDFQMVGVSAYIKADKTPPDFKVDEFTEVTNQLQYTITGTVEQGATVFVNNVQATVEGDKFTVKINILPAPSVTQVEVKASDKYGNSIKKNVGKIVNILFSKIVLIIGSEKMTVNDKEVAIKPAPMIISGKTLVPLRAVADAFGASVNWDAESRTASIILRDKTILITIDKDIAIVNGEPKAIGAKAIVLSGRVMVPFRFIAEAFGAQVDYNGETKTITLSLEVRP